MPTSADDRSNTPHRPLVLDVPNPPPDMRYADMEDFQNREILKANGIGLTGKELLRALDSDVNVLQAAAAHLLGENGDPAATQRLRELISSPDDLVKVEAAYAIARNGPHDAVEPLTRFLDDPLEGYISAPLAAGYLARLSDPRGWPVIVEALGSKYPDIRMIGSKQLSLFLPFHGRQGIDGAPMDVHREIGRALQDPGTDVQWQVLSQLREAPPVELRPVLEAYASATIDPGLKHAAEDILTRIDDESRRAQTDIAGESMP